jgi:carboxyl-terminal processing protease
MLFFHTPITKIPVWRGFMQLFPLFTVLTTTTLIMKRIFVAWTVTLLIPCLAAHSQSSVRSKAISVKRMIELNHFSPRVVDDSFSISMFKKIMRAADSRRLMFTDAEYKSLLTYRMGLDDELQGKSWVFVDLFQSLYKKALTRADSIVQKQLQKPFDFNVAESVTRSREDSYEFAADVNALAARWSRYLKFVALDQLYDIMDADTTGKTTFKSVITASEPKVRERIKTGETRWIKRILEHPGGYPNYVTELYLNAIATGFDPHTNYFSPAGKEDFKEALSTEMLSFGIELEEDDNGKIVIERLTPGGPGWKSGDLNKGDELLSLQWEGKEAVDMAGATLEEAYDVLEQSSTDRMVFKFQKSDGTIKIVLLRKEKIDNEENIVKGFVLKGEKKIGYILLPGFYTEWENESGSSCANDVAKEIVKLKRENIDGLILDVRFNGGGSLGEAMDMIGIFIDEGPLAGQKMRDNKLSFLKDPNRGTIYNGPMVLMVNGQSASASEMLAASLQDYNRAVIVGSNTFGKATMQQMLPLDTTYKVTNMAPPSSGADKDIVKITLGKLYRVSGETAQLNGVKPDVMLPDAFDGMEYREKFLPAALQAETVTKNGYYRPLAALPVGELSKKSKERVDADQQFTAIKKLNDVVRSRRSKNETIPLKWDEFEKWSKQRDAELEILEGETTTPTNKYTVDNHSLDKTLLTNNEFAREINKTWLEDISEDIYIREAFLVLCDLIKLR